jgi:hypothetical protein
MKKQKPTKEIITQYIYDYGLEATCQLLNITEEQITSPQSYSDPKIRNTNNKSVVINSSVSQIIEKNYTTLYSKYVKNKSKLSMCQTSEDAFHTTLIKAMEELSTIDEKQVLDYIDYRLKMVNFQIKQDQKELYKRQTYLEDANTEESYKTKN